MDWFKEIPSYSYGAAFVDLDNDGDLDYIVNNINDKAFVYKNTTIENSKKTGNFIRIKLNGKKNNISAYGAKIELWSNGKYQFQEHFLSRGYISSVDPIVHFGLAKNTKIDSIKITWPASGFVSIIKNIAANQIVTVDEKTSIQIVIHPSKQKYLFSKEESVIDYNHEQNDFYDFGYSQNIIPHKFSQIGPRMQKGDLNGDGLNDIIIGSTNKSPTKVFLNDGTKFNETEIKGLTNKKDFSESDFAIIDIDNDGDNDIIALAGGYESRDENMYKHFLYENINGSFTKRELPIPPFPASIVRPFDYDNDGDIDLFIGARIKMEMFPFAENSWILINENGEFKAENTFGYDLGMVTDAIWSDYDGDGWKDLLITREWNSIAILKNINGEKFKAQNLPEIESMHGIWYSIAAGDFDQDGDSDYILGNLGNNHRFTVSDKYPLKIYADDLDLNGSIDPISTGFWKDINDVMQEFPINYLDELGAQTSLFFKRF